VIKYFRGSELQSEFVLPGHASVLF
jgi:hypothetical protein